MANVSEDEYIRRLAAMPTTIEMPYNSVVRAHINMYAERKRSLVGNMLGMGLYYMPIFEEALDRYGLPLELKYLPVIESAPSIRRQYRVRGQPASGSSCCRRLPG